MENAQVPYVIIGMPTDSHLSVEFVDSYVAMLNYTLRHYNMQIKFEHMFIQGVRTDKNRNSIVQYLLEKKADGVLFLDTDMVYPSDILVRYLESGKAMIGGVYFKRSKPHFPIVYKFSGNPGIPFNAIDPLELPENTLVPVDGLGTGGLFIRREVFEKLQNTPGQDPWFYYGDNYHLPYKADNQTTHDLVFCKKAREAGFEIFVDTGVQMGHITNDIVTAEHWRRDRDEEPKKVAPLSPDHIEIIIPAYGVDAVEKLKATIRSIENCDYPSFAVKVVVDGDLELAEYIRENRWEAPHTVFMFNEENKGYGNTVNETIQNSKSNFFVYLAQDVLVGATWLTEAMQVYKESFPDLDGVVYFNDGRKTTNANHALVHRNFIAKYTGTTLFYPGYKHYYVDKELTEVAEKHGKIKYAPNAVALHMQAKSGLSEVDKSYQKGLATADADLAIFVERKQQGFPHH